MDKELQLLMPMISNQATIEQHNHKYITGKIASHNVAVIKCGIGKVNAALATREIVESFSPDLIINTGVAGGTGAAKVLDVVISTGVAYHDVWCPGSEYGQVEGCPRIFETPERFVQLACLSGSSNIKKGIIASGDIFVNSPEQVAHILNLYPDALAVDMESGAVAQTAWLAGIDFLAVRIVSDTPGGEDNISQYQNFWNDAPKRAFEILMTILQEVKD